VFHAQGHATRVDCKQSVQLCKVKLKDCLVGGT
jgi:hypothetical protein